jgi:tetratricopeptide (TPR) repeat protein
MVIGDEKYRDLQRHLPSLLIAHMVESPITFMEITTQASGNSRSNNIPGLDSSKHDLILRAEYSISDKQFYVKPYLYDLRKHSFEYFEGTYFPLNNILDCMKTVANQIEQYLNLSEEHDFEQKKIALKCFSVEGNSPELQYMLDDIALGLSVNLNNPRVNVTPFNASRSICSKNIDPIDILEQLGVDALLSGDARIIGDQIVLTPWILVKGNPVVKLPEIIEAKQNYFEMEENLVADVSDFINNTIKEKMWDTRPLDLLSSDYRVYWTQGMQYFDNAEYYMAAYMFNKALTLNPMADTVMTNLGIVREWQGRYTEAIKIFKQALEINPTYDDGLYALGYAYGVVGKYNDAIGTFLRLKELHPDKTDVDLSLAHVYSLLNENKKAISWYRSALRRKEGSASIRNEIGQAYYSSSNYDSAFYFFTLVLNDHPLDSTARSYIAQIYSKQGEHCLSKHKYNDAVKVFEKAKEYSKNESVFNYLMIAYAKLNRFQDSNNLIAEGLRLGFYDSTTIYYTQAEDMRIEMYYARQGHDNDKHALLGGQILKLLQYHIELNQNDPAGYYLFGNTYINLINYSKAVPYLEKSVLLDSINFKAYLDLGESYILNNTPEKVGPLFLQYPQKQILVKRDVMLELFLRSAAGVAARRRDNDAEGQLDAMIRKGGRINSWNFDPFIKWLASANGLSVDEKEIIALMQRRMEKILD